MNYVQITPRSLPKAPLKTKPFQILTAVGAVIFFLIMLEPLFEPLFGYGQVSGMTWVPFLASLGLSSLGGLGWIYFTYAGTTPGIKHNAITFKGMTFRGIVAWVAGVLITAFYIFLYFYDDLKGFGAPALLDPWIRMLDPLSQLLAKRGADRWFLYGTLYTLAVLVMGTRMLMKYRHNRYHMIRTCSVMFFQLGFSFLIPSFLKRINEPEFYFTYFWPLKPDYLFPSSFSSLMQSGNLGFFMVSWGLIMTFIGTPVLTYFFGKRWYCSWVCGCGGLAETLGDPYRHLSNKSEKAWVVERWLIHSVLVSITVITILLWANDSYGGSLLGGWTYTAKSVYGLYIGAIFSGVIGVGFYPILGSRVWCRFGCPMAAILGILQRTFSRFRITVNGDQCISCGNCSTYCEMGIDVRAYAQRGENIVRASCVGCGVCAAVCPRGVLALEGGPRLGGRFTGSEKGPLNILASDLTSRNIYS